MSLPHWCYEKLRRDGGSVVRKKRGVGDMGVTCVMRLIWKT